MDIIFYGYAVADAFGEGHFIGIFEFTAKCDAPGDGGNFQWEFLEFPSDIINGGISLDIRIEGENQFLDIPFRYPRHQGFDMQLIGANAIQRRNDASQNMVHPMELLGAFDGNYIPDVFHHTNQLLPAGRIAADIAEFAIGNILTAFAEFDLIPHGGNTVAEMLHSGIFLFDQVQSQAQGRFFPNAG